MVGWESRLSQLHTPSWRPPAPLNFHLERSFLADKIKAFPQPNHYLIFEAIIELIVSISRVSSCSRLSLSCARRRKGRRAQPARRRKGWSWAGPGSCPAAFSRDRPVEGPVAPIRGLQNPAASRAPRHCRGSASVPSRHTGTPDVAREGEPAEPADSEIVKARPGPGSAEESEERAKTSVPSALAGE